MSGHSSAVNGAAFRCSTARESAGLPVSIPLWMPTHLRGPARTMSEMSRMSPGFVTGADGSVRGVTMRDAGLGHDVPEEGFDCVLVWLHRLPVRAVVPEDGVRAALDRRLPDLRGH